jgi:hypothetical protein
MFAALLLTVLDVHPSSSVRVAERMPAIGAQPGSGRNASRTCRPDHR